MRWCLLQFGDNRFNLFLFVTFWVNWVRNSFSLSSDGKTRPESGVPPLRGLYLLVLDLDLIQFNAPPERAFAQRLIELGVLSLLTTTASFVAPLVDRKQLVREHGYGALELWLVAKYSIDSELTNQKFGFFCETLKQSNELLVSKGVFHGH
jgi:hypothetical protein